MCSRREGLRSALRFVLLAAVLLCLVRPLGNVFLLTSDIAVARSLFRTARLNVSRFAQASRNSGQAGTYGDALIGHEELVQDGAELPVLPELQTHGKSSFEQTLAEESSPPDNPGEDSSDVTLKSLQSGGLSPAVLKPGAPSFGVSTSPGGFRNRDPTRRAGFATLGRPQHPAPQHAGVTDGGMPLKPTSANMDVHESAPGPRRFAESGGSLSLSVVELTSILPIVERDGVIVLTLATAAFYAFLKNWECYAGPILGRRFVVLTNDVRFGERLAARDGLHVLVREAAISFGSATENAVPEFANYGTVNYQRLMLSRTEVVAELLGLRSVLITDNDAVWISDPFPALNVHRDAHIVASDDGDEQLGRVLCGGFLFLRRSDTALRLWLRVLRRHRKLVRKAEEAQRLRYPSASEQTILNAIINSELHKESELTRTDAGTGSQQRKRKLPLRVGYLNQHLFPSGRQYFERQYRGSADGTVVDPVVVHNNWVTGAEKKLERFKRYKLWALGNSFPLALQPGSSKEHAEDVLCRPTSYVRNRR